MTGVDDISSQDRLFPIIGQPVSAQHFLPTPKQSSPLIPSQPSPTQPTQTTTASRPAEPAGRPSVLFVSNVVQSTSKMA